MWKKKSSHGEKGNVGDWDLCPVILLEIQESMVLGLEWWSKFA